MIDSPPIAFNVVERRGKVRGFKYGFGAVSVMGNVVQYNTLVTWCTLI